MKIPSFMSAYLQIKAEAKVNGAYFPHNTTKSSPVWERTVDDLTPGLRGAVVLAGVAVSLWTERRAVDRVVEMGCWQQAQPIATGVSERVSTGAMRRACSALKQGSDEGARSQHSL